MRDILFLMFCAVILRIMDHFIYNINRNHYFLGSKNEKGPKSY